MKTYSTLILIFFLLNTFCISAQEPPEGTYKIIIKNSLSKEDNFTLVGQTLIENDFQIANKDKEFYTITTDKKSISRNTVNLILNFVIKDSAILVTGKITNVYGSGFYGKDSEFRVENKGMRKSMLKDSFDAMFNISKKIGTHFEFISDLKKRRPDNDDIYY